MGRSDPLAVREIFFGLESAEEENVLSTKEPSLNEAGDEEQKAPYSRPDGTWGVRLSLGDAYQELLEPALLGLQKSKNRFETQLTLAPATTAQTLTIFDTFSWLELAKWVTEKEPDVERLVFEDIPLLEPEDPEDEKEKFIIFDTLALSVEEASTKINNFKIRLPLADLSAVGGGTLGIFSGLPKLNHLFRAEGGDWYIPKEGTAGSLKKNFDVGGESGIPESLSRESQAADVNTRPYVYS